MQIKESQKRIELAKECLTIISRIAATRCLF
jgi:hypothetical protein